MYAGLNLIRFPAAPEGAAARPLTPLGPQAARGLAALTLAILLVVPVFGCQVRPVTNPAVIRQIREAERAVARAEQRRRVVRLLGEAAAWEREENDPPALSAVGEALRLDPANPAAAEIHRRLLSYRDPARLRTAAEAGDAQAMSRLGHLYLTGSGVERDDAQALAWYRRAARAGSRRALVHCGVMHATGRGGLRDDAAAVRCFAEAAGRGCAEAMRHLGWHYQHGRGVTRDERVGFDWIVAAANAGDGQALEWVRTGEPVPPGEPGIAAAEPRD